MKIRVQDLTKLSTRMFKTNPSRTWLTVLGMGVGIAAVVILVGLGFGLQGILMEQIVFGDTMMSLNVANPPSKTVVLTDAQLEDFLKIKNVKDTSPLATLSAVIKLNDLAGNVTLQGVKPNYFKYAGVLPSVGTVFALGDEQKDGDKVLLSTAALRLFNVEPNDAVGKKVTIRASVPKPDNTGVQEIEFDKEYEIKGVVEDPSNISVFIPLTELSSRFTIPAYEKAQIRVSDSKFLDAVQADIMAKGFTVSAFSKTVEQANKIFTGIQVVLALFGGIALIVSSIGMFNTMTVTLLERTSEIGIMRTIGASPTDIKVLFVSESVVMGFLGGMMGILLGVSFGEIVNFMLNQIASKFGGTAMAIFRFPFWFLFFISSFSAFVGFLTGVFPARRAASLSPLEAIRYK